MKSAYYGLGTFYRFLDQSKRHMESDAAVLRLAWKPGVAPSGDDAAPAGVWIQLEEPPTRPNEPESTFRAFLDENVRELYELPAAEDLEPRRRGAQRKFDREFRIEVLDRDPQTTQVLLKRAPRGEELALRPNTLTLQRQIDAIKELQNAPSKSQVPLVRLMQSAQHASWPSCEPTSVDDWLVLTDDARPGTSEQRDFVRLALATPDFALLEGPPGSGKTTAICELLLQLALQGKRALLCASTHVAVDNVLERLMDERNPHRDLVIPVRIGERRNVSDKARPWQIEHFVKTERERLLRELQRQPALTESQQALLEAIRHERDTNEPTAIERMVLDAANVVCGTTIGILQHPDIRKGGIADAFDVLIVDEASKTTFQEFLVPALYARRWIIVGDPKQLSPYVDDEAMAVNIESCLPDAEVRNACIDVFMAAQGDQRRRVAAVVAGSEAARVAYTAQAAARDVELAHAGDGNAVHAAVVVGNLDALRKRQADLPLDVATVRAPEGELDQLRRRAHAWLQLEGRSREEQPEWASEVGWRLARLYEQRFAKEVSAAGHGRRSGRDRLRQQVEGLLPADKTGVPPDEVWSEIDRVRRVALPSILESLRYGFERDPHMRNGTALSDGLPAEVRQKRHVLLHTQHRMHPEIAHLPHMHVYDGDALITPPGVEQSRAWAFPRYESRAVWIDVRGGFQGRFNSNEREARAVLKELREFDRWAAINPRDDGRPWEVAVLTFYRGQERELRTHLRAWSGQRNAMRTFARGPRQRAYLTIELCTVDRFQGHEADLVFITFASARPTIFLESPNRLNVALTRARYQRVIVGDRMAMARSKGTLLGVLAENKDWERSLNGGEE